MNEVVAPAVNKGCPASEYLLSFTTLFRLRTNWKQVELGSIVKEKIFIIITYESWPHQDFLYP